MWGKLYGDLIINGTYQYSYVVGKRPDLKVQIDKCLTDQSRAALIIE